MSTVSAFTLTLAAVCCSVANSDTLNVGIIGSGISGASCSYYLSKLFPESDEIAITVYESLARAGGRVRETKVGSGKYEAGASIIHPSNRLIHHFESVLGLKKRAPEPSMSIGFFDGEQFSLKTSSWHYVELVQMLWRYGYDLLRLNSMVTKLVAEFSNIYNHQKSGYAFTTVQSLVDSMSHQLRDAMDVPFDEFLKREGFSKPFIDELANVAVRVNYGQNVRDMHGFVGSVSLAAVQPGLSSVHNGNSQIAAGLLTKSGAKVLYGKRVQLVRKLPSGRFKLTTIDLNTNKVDVESPEFDHVVLAAPQTTEDGEVRFEGFGRELRSNTAPYHRTVSTFVSGVLAPEAFRLASLPEVPDNVFSTNASLFYSSVARNFRIDYKKQGFWSHFLPNPSEPSDASRRDAVYKVFSSQPLTNAESEFLFRRQVAEKIVDFRHAYPEYKRRGELAGLWHFELDQGLYHTSVIEWAASAMETAAIGGRNVALLIFNRVKGHLDDIDPFGEGAETEARQQEYRRNEL